MVHPRDLLTAMLVASVALAYSLAPARAAEWPARRINIVVPFAAGGGADPVARLIANDLSKHLGKPVTVDFRPGANGTIGSTIVAKARPDGYTLLLTSPAPITSAKQLNAELAYDPQRDFVPIIHIADSPLSLITNADFAPRTFDDLLAFAKQKPRAITVAISGVGGLGHQAAALVAYRAGIKFTYVPYNGTGSIMADLMGGQINAVAGFPAAFVESIKEGKLRGLVLLSDKRMTELPDMPTIVESGYPNAQLSAWYVMFAPKGTPNEITSKIGKIVGEYLTTDEAKGRFKAIGYNVTALGAERAAEIIAKDTEASDELFKAGVMGMP